MGGQGWKLDAATNHLTVDELTVRGQMSIYELVINQIRATNGSFWISDSMKCTNATHRPDVSPCSFNINFDTDNGRRGCTFIADDIVKAQVFDGRNVVVVIGKVAFVGTGYF